MLPHTHTLHSRLYFDYFYFFFAFFAHSFDIAHTIEVFRWIVYSAIGYVFIRTIDTYNNVVSVTFNGKYVSMMHETEEEEEEEKARGRRRGSSGKREAMRCDALRHRCRCQADRTRTYTHTDTLIVI